MNVSAVIVTRGDVDLEPVIDSLKLCDEVLVWNNQLEGDLAVYGRYKALEQVSNRVALTVDDDVLLPQESVQKLLDAYEPRTAVCNMPQQFRHRFYREHALVGFGAVFDVDLPEQAFATFAAGEESRRTWSMQPELFYRTCDIVFTGLTPCVLLDLPYKDREFASDETRMWRQPNHQSERTLMLELVRQQMVAA